MARIIQNMAQDIKHIAKDNKNMAQDNKFICAGWSKLGASMPMFAG